MSTSARRKAAGTGTTGRGGSAPGMNTGAERSDSTGATDSAAKQSAQGAGRAGDSEGSATNSAVTEGTSAPAAETGMTERQRTIGFLVCLVTIVLAILDLQIVSAATVPIVRDLDPEHGVDKIPWLVSSFALASAAMLPLYGKLCDVLGPKRVFTGAIATFLVG
ncbi:hypothetical protein ABT408_34655, partial [Streptomyces halstedii]